MTNAPAAASSSVPIRGSGARSVDIDGALRVASLSCILLGLYVGNFALPPFCASGVLGVFVCHLVVCEQRRERSRTLALALGLELGLEALSRAHGVRVPFLSHGVGCGIASLIVAAPPPREGAARLMRAATATPVLLLATQLGLFATVGHTRVWDHAAFRFDAALTGEPMAFVVGRALDGMSAARALLEMVYVQLPLFLLVIAALTVRRDPDRAADALAHDLAIAVSGFALYHFLPVVGPCFVASDFPHHLPASVALRYFGTAPRNCMPSLHTAWALTAFLDARVLGRRMRLVAGAWLGMTLLATLGFGLHYLTDLVVAVPFTLAARALCRGAHRALAVGAAAVAVWFVVLRFDLAISTPLAWALVAATIAVSLWLARCSVFASRSHA